MFFSSRHWVGMGEAGPSRPCSIARAAGICRQQGVRKKGWGGQRLRRNGAPKTVTVLAS